MPEKQLIIDALPESPISQEALNRLQQQGPIKEAAALISYNQAGATLVEAASIRLKETGIIIGYYPEEESWKVLEHVKPEEDESQTEFSQRMIFMSQVAMEEFTEHRGDLPDTGLEGF